MNPANEIVYLYVDDIIPNRFQPREIFDEKALKELSDSIKEHGVIQPIIVRKVEDRFEIIAGERRYKASILAGLTRIPAIVRNMDDKESAKVALLENLQRKNLTPIEEARTFQKILELDNITQEELGRTMGKSQSSIANKLRLLSLPNEVQDALLKEKISERHARSILNVNSSDDQINLLHKVINNRLTVRDLDLEIQKLSNPDVEEQPRGGSLKDIINIDDIVTSTFEEPKVEPAINIEIPKIDFEETKEEPVINVEIPEEQSTSSFDFPNIDSLRQNAPKVDVPEVKVEPMIEPETEILGDFPDIKMPSFDELVPKEDTNQVTTGINIDVDQIRQNAEDIYKEEEKPTVHIEDLVRPVNEEVDQPKEEIPSFRFVPTVEEPKVEKVIEDFEIKIPKIDDNINSIIPNVDKVEQEVKITKTNYKDAISVIRTELTKLRELGHVISADELDFENRYQIVIKIDKE